ncbi:MAG TPA: Uma2 family endonuclease [Thermoanaerobaculia bacterium]|jgi:Uma2 family endonuclease
MAEPARKTSHGESGEPDDESSGFVLLQRWVERPDGRMELVERPLTPEEYLDPQDGDKWVQGKPHSDARFYFHGLLSQHFLGQEDVLILDDVKHLLGPGLPGPAPDISVVRARDPESVQESLDVARQGVPWLVIEVVSPKDRRIQRMDEEDKVDLYQRVGIPDYLLVYLPRYKGQRFRIRGYHLGPDGCYQPTEPDADRRLLCETTGLLFGLSPEGDRVELFNARTGEQIRTPVEEAARAAEALQAAEKKAARETEARKAERAAREMAEWELERLRAEIEQLKKTGR